MPAQLLACQRSPRLLFDERVVADLSPADWLGSARAFELLLRAVEVKCAVRAALVASDPRLVKLPKKEAEAERAAAARMFAACEPAAALATLRRAFEAEAPPAAVAPNAPAAEPPMASSPCGASVHRSEADNGAGDAEVGGGSDGGGGGGDGGGDSGGDSGGGDGGDGGGDGGGNGGGASGGGAATA
eukprot:7095575-Prymnesium_polylepis.1